MVGRQHAHGVWIERDDRGPAPALARVVHCGLDDRLVPAMNSVKDADGQREPLPQTLQPIKIADDFHGGD